MQPISYCKRRLSQDSIPVRIVIRRCWQCGVGSCVHLERRTFTAFRAHCRNQLQHLCVKERLWAIGERQLLTLVAMERGSAEESITCPSFTPCGGFLPSLFITSVVQSVPSEPLSRSPQSCAVWLSLLVPHSFERLNDNRTPVVACLPPTVSFLFQSVFLEKMFIP